MSEIEEFELTDEDFQAIEIAKKVARRFLEWDNISPKKIIGLGNALYALERMPLSTAGAFCEFGICYRAGTEEFNEIRYIDFRITELSFEISIGGCVYDKVVGSDSFSEPGWMIEVGGYRRTECELFNLEGAVEEYLNLGAEITVCDESEIEYE